MATKKDKEENPFGKEIKGLTGPIGVSKKGKKETYTKKGQLTGYGIAQKLRAGHKLKLGKRKKKKK